MTKLTSTTIIRNLETITIIKNYSIVNKNKKFKLTVNPIHNRVLKLYPSNNVEYSNVKSSVAKTHLHYR